MAKYDDASWHYGGDFPKDVEQREIERGSIEIVPRLNPISYEKPKCNKH